MNQCLILLKLSLFVMTSLIELALTIIFICIFTFWLKAKQAINEKDYVPYFLIFYISIGEIILCSLALFITLIFGCFAFFFLNGKRLRCYSISALIFFIVTFGLLVANFIFPTLQKPDLEFKAFNIVVILYNITHIINIIKLLFYIITIFFAITEIQTQLNKEAPYINKEEINENITPELYNSFLEVCKHPDNYDLQREFTKLMMKRSNKSFENVSNNIIVDNHNSAKNLMISI